MTIVRTRTPSGEAIVILPEAEFERLRDLAEDASDSRTLELSQGRLAAGEEELLNESDLEVLRAAPSALSFWRFRRGKDLACLASECGVDVGLLTAIERGERIGETGLYERLAHILDVDVEDIVPSVEEA